MARDDEYNMLQIRNGQAGWGAPMGIVTASGAPSDDPEGTLPLYINNATDDLYVFNGTIWVGPYNLGS